MDTRFLKSCHISLYVFLPSQLSFLCESRYSENGHAIPAVLGLSRKGAEGFFSFLFPGRAAKKCDKVLFASYHICCGSYRSTRGSQNFKKYFGNSSSGGALSEATFRIAEAAWKMLRKQFLFPFFVVVVIQSSTLYPT